MKRILSLLLALVLALSLLGCVQPAGPTDTQAPSDNVTETSPSTGTDVTIPTGEDGQPLIDEFGSYNSKDEVALYIHVFGHLPHNYYTKSQAKENGWSTSGIDRFEEKAAIGGDTFYNREGHLPNKAGRVYTECDIGTWGRTTRGAQRIVFSNDGLVYYTSDHYNTFTLLYGDPDA